MAKLHIRGGRRLSGEVTLQGSKNSALPILAASLMVRGTVVLHNCPDLSDVRAAVRILNSLGCKCSQLGHDVYIDASVVKCDAVPDDLMREMRSSVVFLGAILSRCASATISAPGGCELGPRPIDLHLKAIKEMGFSVNESGGYINCARESARSKTDIILDFPSVGATENIILAATLSKGRVVLHNAAKEPEISDLADFINGAGGKIYGAGTDTVEIFGVNRLYSTEHTIIPDRIVAATYMSAVSATGGDITVKNTVPSHINAIVTRYREMGCEVNFSDDDMRVVSNRRMSRITKTRSTVYPGFPTDAGPLLVTSLALAEGTSLFVETIFDNRFNYAEELKLLGADIKVFGRLAVIEGVRSLHGANVRCTDLRGGAAAVVAALAAEGESTVDKICHIERGYENIQNALSALSADIKRE